VLCPDRTRDPEQRFVAYAQIRHGLMPSR
jgi:hypothetical protein